METATSSAQRPLQGNLQYPSPQNLHHLLRTEHLCDLCGDHECLPSARALRLQDSSNTGSIQVAARPVLKKAGRGSREKEATTQRAPEAPKKHSLPQARRTGTPHQHKTTLQASNISLGMEDGSGSGEAASQHTKTSSTNKTDSTNGTVQYKRLHRKFNIMPAQGSGTARD